jgi:hypothetical protein
MLVRPELTYIDKATKAAARVFPTGSSWLNFESRLPATEVFRDAVMDPAIGIDGPLALQTFATCEWQNWTSSIQIATFELATRIGLPPLDNQAMAPALASIFNALPSTLAEIRELDDPLSVVPQILNNLAAQVIQQLAGSSGLIAQTFAQVLAAAVWAVQLVASYKADQLEKDVPLAPLQSVDPATDTWQVNRVFEVLRKVGKGDVQYPDGGLKLASNADYTSLFLPAYKHGQPWKIQWRDLGIAAQQGDPQEANAPRGETEYKFNVGDGSTFGYMPGTGTMLRVLQASFRFYATMRANPVDRYTIRCRAVDRGCWQTAAAFDGTRDCRQCVTAESVWPTQGIAWAIGGSVPLNVTTPGENVGAFYSSTNKLIGLVEDLATRPGPQLYTVDWFAVHDAWQASFERFWEFARSYWTLYRGWGWRGLISRLATLMVAFEYKGAMQLGGRLPAMPAKLVASPREDPRFGVNFDESIFKRVIAPFCLQAAQLQRSFLDTTEVAYVPPGAGALYNSEGKVRNNPLGREFVRARTELLDSTKRMAIDLRRVSDPEYRAELERRGVKPSPVNPLLQGSPGVGAQVLKPDQKPPRALRPKRVGMSAIAGMNELARQRPARQGLGESTPARAPTTTTNTTALKVAGAAAAVLAAVAGGALMLGADDERNE